LDYAPCRPIADGIYQVTIYADNELGTDGFGTFNFKFFDQRGWVGAEETSSNFTVSLPLVSRTDVGNVGNVSGSPTPFQGVYQITLNRNDKTIKTIKLNNLLYF
jgi:phage-related protein